MNCLYSLAIKPFSVASFKYFLPLHRLSFFLMACFTVQELVSLIRPCFYIFPSIFTALRETDLRKHWYNLCHRRFCLCSLLGVFVSSLVFIFKPLLVVLVYSVKVCSHFIDSHVTVQLFQHHLLKTMSFPLCTFYLLSQGLIIPRCVSLFFSILFQ